MSDEGNDYGHAKLKAEDALGAFRDETLGTGRIITVELAGALQSLLEASEKSIQAKDVELARLKTQLQSTKQETHPGIVSPRETWPDDSDSDEAITEASSLPEALWEIAEKYEVPLTNNLPRWQQGQFLRPAGGLHRGCTQGSRKIPQVTIRDYSMTKFHVNSETGEPGECRARAGNCPFGSED